MSNLYRFGQFVLDSAKRTLSRGDSPVSVTPKPFDVLLFLTENPNRVVTKEELQQAVWGDTVEGNLDILFPQFAPRSSCSSAIPTPPSICWAAPSRTTSQAPSRSIISIRPTSVA